ncbi:PIG-L deacetylase family protein [Shewanella seohaensis]|uniref:PIG-L deacetylase family protein n=1 Tax=Shewanella seohaensis TaxID=755175 RepID=UPI0035BB0800
MSSLDLLSNFKSVLVLAPHTDDGELGAGGTIAKLIEAGAKVTYVAFSTASESVPKHLPPDILKSEVKRATSKLGILTDNLIIYDYQVRKLNYHRQEILEDLIRLRNDNQFDLILTPSLQDIHQDHATIAQESLRAFKNTSILGYELIWNNLSFDTKCFVKLQENHIRIKYNSLLQYESQGERNYLSENFIFSLATTRGVQAGCQYAECFEIIRLYL